MARRRKLPQTRWDQNYEAASWQFVTDHYTGTIVQRTPWHAFVKHLWQCDHQHTDRVSARACGEAELARRQENK